MLKHYRPVSNLAFLSKFLERAVLLQLTEHMEASNMFCPVQSAYHARHSTKTALLKLQNDIMLNLDSGKGVILVLLNLSAAFDTIGHDILASRLQSRIGFNSSMAYHKAPSWGLLSSLYTWVQSMTLLEFMVSAYPSMPTTPNCTYHLTLTSRMRLC